jgi:hypothetical protein
LIKELSARAATRLASKRRCFMKSSFIAVRFRDNLRGVQISITQGVATAMPSRAWPKVLSR